MTNATATPHYNAPRASAPQPEITGWSGWIVFGAMMMLILGSFHAIQGLIALFNDEYYLVGANGLIVQLDYTAWGWTHLILGSVIVLAGVGLFAGQMWARVLGIALAALSAVLNFAFIAAYPVWSSIVIAIDVLLVYALAVHGRELKTQR